LEEIHPPLKGGKRAWIPRFFEKSAIMSDRQMEDEREFIEALPGDLKRIADLAGLDAAIKIAREFRGTTLYIPDIVTQFRDEAIKYAYDNGDTVRKLAMKHRITERTVWRILKKPTMDLPAPLLRFLMNEHH
jgi:hypothetical protein